MTDSLYPNNLIESLDHQSDSNDIFTIEPVQLQFEIANLVSLKVANNILVFALKNGKICRIDLNQPQNVDEIQLFENDKANDSKAKAKSIAQNNNSKNINKINNIFLDPSGNHLIVSTTKNDNYYLNSTTLKPKILNKFKGVDISYIAWCPIKLTKTTAANFLIGTRSGLILESTLEYSDEYFKKDDRFLKTVWKNPKVSISNPSSNPLNIKSNIIGTNNNITNNKNNTNNNLNSKLKPIDGISIKYLKNFNKFIVIITTGDDIFYYNYKSPFNNLNNLSLNQSIFQNFFKNEPSDYERFEDLGLINGNKFTSNFSSYSWVTNTGIVYGLIDPFENLSSLSSLSNFSSSLLSYDDHSNFNTSTNNHPAISNFSSSPLAINLPSNFQNNIKNNLLSTNKFFNNSKILLNIELPKNKHKFKSLLLSKYHLILLRDKEILIINQINDQLVSHKQLPILTDNERFIGLSADYYNLQSNSITYWLYSNYNIYEIVINNESKNIWKNYLEINEFDKALKSIKETTNDPINKDIILLKKGQYLLKKEQYLDAAAILAYSTEPFESITLKLIDENQFDALRKYLIIKLSIISKKENYMQKIMLSSWIVELFLERLNSIDDLIALRNKESISNLSHAPNDNEITTEDLASPSNFMNSNPENSIRFKKHSKHNSSIYSLVNLSLNELVKTKTDLEKSYQNFLVDNKDNLDKETIYQIITAHNRQSELLFFANIINDYDFILNYWINLEQWSEALKILYKKNDPKVIYKYSTALLANYSKETVDIWIQFHKILNPIKFIPAILSYNMNNNQKIKPENHQGLRYLNFVTNTLKNTDTIIHNTLLSILITYPDVPSFNLSNTLNNSPSTNFYNLNQNKTLSLKQSIASIKETSTVLNIENEVFTLKYLQQFNDEIYYDSDFILRLCLQYKKIQSAIHIFSILENFQQAIDLSLEYNLIKLARIIADRPIDNPHLRKELWLKISKKMIEKACYESVVDNSIQNVTSKDKPDAEEMINKNSIEIQNLLKFLLSNCDLLTIKDLLPLFPNFLVIDTFKNEIIKNLENYGLKMNQLNQSINNTLNISKKIKTEITNYQKRFSIIEPGEQCSTCRYPL
ncbi:tethering complex subunit PEP3 ASCRUDRAFT_73611, partial [Ascoidea rubescens DSM 1968]